MAHMQQRVLEVDDLAQKLPGVGVRELAMTCLLVGLFVLFEPGITHGSFHRPHRWTNLQGFEILARAIGVRETVGSSEV